MADRVPVEPPLDVGTGSRSGLQLRAETEPSAALGVVERLDAQAVAREQELPLPRVPEREGEHAAQPLDAARPELLVEVHDDLGVGRRREAVAARHELAPQLAVVVDLAVEDDPDRAVLVGDRLLAGLEVDDGQPAHAEPDACRRGRTRRRRGRDATSISHMARSSSSSTGRPPSPRIPAIPHMSIRSPHISGRAVPARPARPIRALIAIRSLSARAPRRPERTEIGDAVHRARHGERHDGVSISIRASAAAAAATVAAAAMWPSARHGRSRESGSRIGAADPHEAEGLGDRRRQHGRERGAHEAEPGDEWNDQGDRHREAHQVQAEQRPRLGAHA